MTVYLRFSLGVIFLLFFQVMVYADNSKPPTDESSPDNDILNHIDFRMSVDVEAFDAPTGFDGKEIGRTSEQDKDEWLIAPIPFYETQVGLGMILLGGYLFQFEDNTQDTPTSFVGGGGMYTSNDSWAGLVMGKLYLGDDQWRVTPILGCAEIRYDFYGIGSDAGDDGTSVKLQTEFFGLSIDAMGRFAEDMYIGPTFGYGDVKTRLREPIEGLPPDVLGDDLDTISSGLGLHYQWDTRDNTFYPKQGHLLDIEGSWQNGAWGATFNYARLDLQLSSYPSLDEQTVLAWRLIGRYRTSHAPFYDLASYDLRGYEKGRYRDRIMLAGEVEYRRHLWKGLSMAAFTSLGEVVNDIGELNTENLLPAVGVGLRYRLTKENPINYRVDVGLGRNDVYVSFMLGEAF